MRELGNVPKTKKYGDYTDPTNKFVTMLPYLQDFLDEYADSSKPRVFYRLVDFALYCNHVAYFRETQQNPYSPEGIETDEYKIWFVENYYKSYILDVSSPEALDYFKAIKKKNIKKNTKKRYYYFIKHYFDFVEKWKHTFENDLSFKSPIPGIELIKFRGSTQSNYDIEMNYMAPDLKAIKRIITHIFYTVRDDRIFYAISLLFYTGARVREICSIRIKDLDLKNRWFKVKVKSRFSDRWGWYFFPKFFVLELKEYLEKWNEKYSQNINYLFPGIRNEQDHLSTRMIQFYLKQAKEILGLQCQTNAHAYRDFINTKRKDKGLTSPYLEFLLNQTAPGGVNPESYMKTYRNKVNLRKLYDDFNPYPTLLKPKPRL